LIKLLSYIREACCKLLYPFTLLYFTLLSRSLALINYPLLSIIITQLPFGDVISPSLGDLLLSSYRVRGVDGSCAKHSTVESYTVIYATNSHTYYYYYY